MIDKGNRAVEPSKGKRVSGLWNEYVDPDTGQSSYMEHPVSTVATYCRPQDHYFEATTPHSRVVRCTKCGLLTAYILGPQILKDGKIVDRVKVSPESL